MSDVDISALRDRLVKHRNGIASSLHWVNDQKRSGADFPDSRDRFVWLSREGVFDYLDRFYGKEIIRVDRALSRVSENKYGVCLGCDGPIESRRLEFHPECEFCTTCQALWENLQEGATRGSTGKIPMERALK